MHQKPSHKQNNQPLSYPYNPSPNKNSHIHPQMQTFLSSGCTTKSKYISNSNQSPAYFYSHNNSNNNNNNMNNNGNINNNSSNIVVNPNIQPNTSYLQNYYRLQQNDRIIKRIINPKRDKIIMRSIQNVKNSWISNNNNSSGNNSNNGNNNSNYIGAQRRKQKQLEQPYQNKVKQYQIQRSRTTYHYHKQQNKDKLKFRKGRNKQNKSRQSQRERSRQRQHSDNKYQGGLTQQQYQIRLQNIRMGKRIINAKSMVRTLITSDWSSSSSYKPSRNRNIPHSRVNNGVKAFFNIRSQPRQIYRQSPTPSSHSPSQHIPYRLQQQSSILTSSAHKHNNNKNNKNYPFCTNINIINTLKSYYGYGPTILCFTKIKIDTNPKLKSSDLLFLELMVNNNNNSCINSSNNSNNNNAKLYCTGLIPYSLLSGQESQEQKHKQRQEGYENSKRDYRGFGIKFALRLKKIGEFVPLKIWKVQGVNTIQVGIVDIQFMQYLHQQSQLRDSSPNNNSIDNNNSQWKTLEYNKQGKTRIIVKNTLQSKIRKTKVDQAQGSISIQYLIYKKKYT